MKQPDDAYCIEQVKQGNTAAFAVLVDRYKQGAFTLCMRIIGNRTDVEEVCQEGFIKAYCALAGFRYESGFGTWLYRIMYNSAISFVRKRKNRHLAYEEVSPEFITDDSQDPMDVTGESGMRRRLVRDAVRALDEVDRTIVSLYYTFGFPLAEISCITSLSETNVKVRLHRARAKLYEEISLKMYVHSLS